MRISRIVIRNFTRQPLTRRISGLCGVTTYAENIGVMNLTRNFSSTVCVLECLRSSSDFALNLGR